MTPVLSEDQMKETVQKFEQYLLDNGAELVHQENWGMCKLAYPIQRKSSGFYHLFEYKAPGNIIQNFEVNMIRDKRIMRFLTVKLDKHAIAYNQKKRDKKNNKVEEQA
jgi:small subunit ribosomal protein S6